MSLGSLRTHEEVGEARKLLVTELVACNQQCGEHPEDHGLTRRFKFLLSQLSAVHKAARSLIPTIDTLERNHIDLCDVEYPECTFIELHRIAKENFGESLTQAHLDEIAETRCRYEQALIDEMRMQETDNDYRRSQAEMMFQRLRMDVVTKPRRPQV